MKIGTVVVVSHCLERVPDEDRPAVVTWEPVELEHSILGIYLGRTSLHEGERFPSRKVYSYNGDEWDYSGGITVSRDVPAVVVQPLDKHNRYRKHFYTQEQYCGGFLSVSR